jgi:hypothetical protein
MGYTRTRRKYRLKFEDEELAGLEVVMGSLSIGEFTELTSSISGGATAETADGVTSLLEKFAGKIASWNLEDDDGQPVPATFDGVKTQELDFIMAIVTAWMDAIAGVDPTSRASANGTGTFPEVSLPMEPLSASRPN